MGLRRHSDTGPTYFVANHLIQGYNSTFIRINIPKNPMKTRICTVFIGHFQQFMDCFLEKRMFCGKFAC